MCLVIVALIVAGMLYGHHNKYGEHVCHHSPPGKIEEDDDDGGRYYNQDEETGSSNIMLQEVQQDVVEERAADPEPEALRKKPAEEPVEAMVPVQQQIVPVQETEASLMGEEASLMGGSEEETKANTPETMALVINQAVSAHKKAYTCTVQSAIVKPSSTSISSKCDVTLTFEAQGGLMNVPVPEPSSSKLIIDNQKESAFTAPVVNISLKEPNRICGEVTFADVPRGGSYAFKYGPIGRAAELSWPDENATSPDDNVPVDDSTALSTYTGETAAL